MNKIEVICNVENMEELNNLNKILIEAKKNQEVVTLVVNDDYHLYLSRIGKLLATKYNSTDMLSDDNALQLLGGMFLSENIPSTYYVRNDITKKIITIKGVDDSE